MAILAITASEAMASECIDRFRVGCPALRAYMRGPCLNTLRAYLESNGCESYDRLYIAQVTWCMTFLNIKQNSVRKTIKDYFAVSYLVIK